MDNWKTYNIGELVDLKQGLAINKGTKHLLCEKSDHSIPLFKIRDLLNGTVEHHVKANEVPVQCIASEDDLIYTRTGQVGHVIRGKVGCIHNNCFKVIPDNRLDRGFLYHFLSNPVIRQYANDIASGSVQKDLNHTAFKSIPIKVPDSLQEQKAIASILSAIDDKIENNLAMNKTLEEMAMALYKHWFVDFGPFQDQEFIDSELGSIPKGWQAVKLEQLVEIKYGKDHKKLDPGIIPVYGSGGIMRYVDSFLFEHESVLVPRKGSLNNIFLVQGPFWSVDTMFFTKMKGENYLKYSYHLLKTMKLGDMDVGSAIPSLTTKLLNSLPVLLPEPKVLKDFEEIITRWFEQFWANEKENQTLTKLRDTLLPKLISGEVRVKDVEQTLTNAL